MGNILIEVKDLSTAFSYEGKMITVVDKVSFKVYEGEILGVVGESGSGKSVTSKSILRLIQYPPGKITNGEILFQGRDILKMSKKELLSVRGNKISMIFQEPMSSLNPVYTCGEQIIEAIVLHQKVNKKEARKKAIAMLDLVGIPSPESRIDCYPHELSGGMRQRIMIAMALSCNPSLLIADEPTTALDPTIQAQIIDLIKSIQKERNMSVLYITHDLGVVAELCDRVIVMYAGRIMEQARVMELFKNPLHPYTKGLMQAIPKLNENKERLHVIKGMVPHILEMPKGCPFHPRCDYAQKRCENDLPELVDFGGEHLVRCWRAEENGKGAVEED